MSKVLLQALDRLSIIHCHHKELAGILSNLQRPKHQNIALQHDAGLSSLTLATKVLVLLAGAKASTAFQLSCGDTLSIN
jgi:hypothetical protein